MSKDESAEERAARKKFGAWLREVEAAAAETRGGTLQIAYRFVSILRSRSRVAGSVRHH